MATSGTLPPALVIMGMLLAIAGCEKSVPPPENPPLVMPAAPPRPRPTTRPAGVPQRPPASTATEPVVSTAPATKPTDTTARKPLATQAHLLVLHRRSWLKFTNLAVRPDGRAVMVTGEGVAPQAVRRGTLGEAELTKLRNLIRKAQAPGVKPSYFHKEDDTIARETDRFHLRGRSGDLSIRILGAFSAAPRAVRLLVDQAAVLARKGLTQTGTVSSVFLRAVPLEDHIAGPGPTRTVADVVARLRADGVKVPQVTAKELDGLPVLRRAVRWPGIMVPLDGARATEAYSGPTDEVQVAGRYYWIEVYNK